MEYVVIVFLIIWAMKYIRVDMRGRDSILKTLLTILFIALVVTGYFVGEIILAIIIVWIFWG